MADEMLSQEDINALMGGQDVAEETSPAPAAAADSAAVSEDASSEVSPAETPVPSAEPKPSAAELADDQKSALEELFSEVNEAGTNVLSTIINNKVEIPESSGFICTPPEFKEKCTGKQVILSSKFIGDIESELLILLDFEMSRVLGDLMMGNDGSKVPEEITDMYESAINEGMNQFINSGMTSISKRSGFADISVEISDISIGEITGDFETEVFKADKVYVRETSMKLAEIAEGKMLIIMSVPVSIDLAKRYLGQIQPETPQKTETSSAPVITPSVQEPLPPKQGIEKNIHLLLDVPVKLSANLGETRILMNDILNMGEGSVVELNKSANEPIDITVGNKVIARGEVVVVDENFGVRITELVTPLERVEISKKIK